MVSDSTPSAPKTRQALANEWDSIARERDRQISAGEDLSFDLVLVPTMFDLLADADKSFILDIGAGTGHFTAKLAQFADRVIAVEPSLRSLELARANCKSYSTVEFVGGTLEEAADTLRPKAITTAVASMTLMTAPDLHAFARTLATILPVGGRFLATFTHPWFWPKYWGYDTAPWFNYSREIFVEAPFRISQRTTEIKTTHIHRPLTSYIDAFGLAGFDVERLVEPLPSLSVQSLYPTPWFYPRFMGLRWVRS